MAVTTITSTPRIELARKFIENTGKNLFLTGKAGTGKTTFLRHLKENSPKRMAVVAPTGVAAINAGGVTIHSFFQLPFGPQIPHHYFNTKPPENNYRFSREKLNIIRSIDLLVIDEISMVRADMLDAIDGVLRKYRYKNKPFGGVQVLMIGDLQQLAPVVKEDDWKLLQPYYSGPFFFQSKVLEQFPSETIELNHIFRQSDDKFIDVLNQIRENRLTQEGVNILQSRYIPDFKPHKGFITLTTHNRQAEAINQRELDAINIKHTVFNAEIDGDFPEIAYPNDASLKLKTGAQVMFLKNDSSRDKLYFNGRIGTIEQIGNNQVTVKCENPEQTITVAPVDWINYKYTLNEATNEIEETPIGKFTQIPLKTAWAITIHKSQGLTFDHAVIDANAAFSHGQVYVALSRCRTLEGLVLSSPVNKSAIISSSSVTNFVKTAEQNTPSNERIAQFQIEYERELISEMFDFSNLGRQLSYLHKEITQNSTVVFGSFIDQLNEMLLNHREKTEAVAQKFKAQLNFLFTQNIVAQDHPQLQQRITKAAEYFLQQITINLKPIIAQPELETDNKVIKKTIEDQLEKIQHTYNTHTACLKACAEKFEISAYLAAKSISNIQKATKKQKNVASSSEASSFTPSVRPGLYAIFKDWRNAKAQELMAPHYMIMQTKTMVDIADKMPVSLKELLKIKGLGKHKVDSFGKEILEIISTYRADKGMEEVALDFSKEPEKPKEKKVPTWLITLEMHKLGLDTTTIAQKRQLAQSTIESHFAQAIKNGELNVEEVVSNQKIKAIKEFVENNNLSSLTAIKTEMGDEYTFSELKMVMAALNMES